MGRWGWVGRGKRCNGHVWWGGYVIDVCLVGKHGMG